MTTPGYDQDRKGAPLPGEAVTEATPLGSEVAVFRDNGQVFHTKTRSVVACLSGELSDPVVWCVGVSGCYLAVRVRRGVPPTITTWEGP